MTAAGLFIAAFGLLILAIGLFVGGPLVMGAGGGLSSLGAAVTAFGGYAYFMTRA